MSDADNDPIRAELARLARVAVEHGSVLAALAGAAVEGEPRCDCGRCMRPDLERIAKALETIASAVATITSTVNYFHRHWVFMREAARRPACRVPQCTGVLRDVAPDARRPIFKCDVCGARDEWRCG